LRLGLRSPEPTIVFEDGRPFLEVRIRNTGAMRNIPLPSRKIRNIRNTATHLIFLAVFCGYHCCTFC
jgi:hypothetical protein